MIVFLPIKPKYAFAITAGTKKYEFRRRGFRQTPSTVVVYAAAPIKRIIGYFHISRIVSAEPKQLWADFSEAGGISEDDFFAYFTGCEEGISIEISKVVELSRPLEPQHIWDDFVAPQSFKYIASDDFDRILSFV